MASIEARPNTDGSTTHRVIWRQKGLPGKQTERFSSAKSAERFKLLVEGSGNRWPTGWVKGEGFADGQHPVNGRLTFRVWAEQAVSLRSKANARTKADYRRDLERHVYPHLGDLPIDDIDATDVVEWIDKLVDAKLAAKTIANIHGLVSSIVADGISHRPPVCDHNPFAGRLPDLPDVRVEEMTFLTPAEFELIYRHIPGYYQPLTLHLWGTGERFSEATAHQVRDDSLDGARQTTQVVRAWKRQPDHTYLLGEPKTRRSRRTLPLSPKLVTVHRRLTAGRAPTDLLFPAMEGGQLLGSTFYDVAWAPAVARARVCDKHRDQRETAAQRAERLERQRETGKRIRPPVAGVCTCEGVLTKQPRVHDLRHSHASQLIAEGLPLPVISRRLGHKSIQVTIDRYGHLLPELDDAVIAAVDRGLAWLDDEDDE